MHVTHFEAGVETGTVVMSHYPLGGNDANTGPRYQQEAELTGFDIVGIERAGTNTFKPNPFLRNRLSPERFDEAIADHADVLDAVARDYDTVIWRGQSTGSFPTLSVVKNRLAKATHLLLEDGMNLRTASDGDPVSPMQGRIDWYNYNKDEKRNMPPSPEPDWQLPEGKPQNPIATGAKFIIEQYHYALLWRSMYSRDAALEIAMELTDIALFIKFLGHSATGTETEVMDMVTVLSEVYEDRGKSSGGSAEMQVRYDLNAWHAYLQFPQFGAKNLLETAKMKSLAS